MLTPSGDPDSQRTFEFCYNFLYVLLRIFFQKQNFFFRKIFFLKKTKKKKILEKNLNGLDCGAAHQGWETGAPGLNRMAGSTLASYDVTPGGLQAAKQVVG
jgi:hypothetical protein